MLDLGGGEQWNCAQLYKDATTNLGNHNGHCLRSDSFVLRRISKEGALCDLIAEFVHNNAYHLGVRGSSQHEQIQFVDWLQCQLTEDPDARKWAPSTSMCFTPNIIW